MSDFLSEQEKKLKINVPNFYEAYELAKKFNDQSNYPTIHTTSIYGHLMSFSIDFSLGFSIFCTREKSQDIFKIEVCVYTIDENYDYPRVIPMEEISFWLPRLMIQNQQFEASKEYR